MKRLIASDLAANLNTQGFIENAEIGGTAQTINLADLPPFLRLLLTTDGTVTKSLEAYYWEPIKIAGVTQQLQEKVISPPGETGKHELVRSVELIGATSGLHYARALSRVEIELLPVHLAQGLLGGEIGIGELVRSSGLDTFRQIIDLGVNNTGPQLEIWRRYLIYVEDSPLIDITEWFPLAIYVDSFEDKKRPNI